MSPSQGNCSICWVDFSSSRPPMASVVPLGSSTEVLASRLVIAPLACGSETEVSTLRAMVPLDLTTGVNASSTP
ncbi:hypothetical protein D3C85_1880780 [compost metagenome]